MVLERMKRRVDDGTDLNLDVGQQVRIANVETD